jgi:AraC-like DNA-binding protein
MGTYFEDAMLVVVISGRGRYYKGKHTQDLEAGTVGLIIGQLGKDPGLMTADPNDPYDHIYCRFTGHEAIAHARNIIQARHGESYVYEPNWRELAQILERALEIGRVIDHGQPRDYLIRQDACLMEALVLLDGNTHHEPHGLTRANLQAYLQDHIAMPASLDPLAEHFGISKSYLCRQAKDLLGVPLHQYWMQLKMEWAKNLLRQPGVSITQAARHVGFNDPLHFSKAFKQRIGMSPRQWRDEFGSGDDQVI